MAIVALAAGITWAVIRIFPTQRNPKKDEKGDKPAKAEANGSGEGQGRLFRRSKRQSS